MAHLLVGSKAHQPIELKPRHEFLELTLVFDMNTVTQHTSVALLNHIQIYTDVYTGSDHDAMDNFKSQIHLIFYPTVNVTRLIQRKSDLTMCVTVCEWWETLTDFCYHHFVPYQFHFQKGSSLLGNYELFSNFADVLIQSEWVYFHTGPL